MIPVPSDATCPGDFSQTLTHTNGCQDAEKIQDFFRFDFKLPHIFL